MNLRRTVISLVTLLGVATTVALSRDNVVATRGEFARIPTAGTPYRPILVNDGLDPLAVSFFCPGVPGVSVPPDPKLGGEVAITNPTQDAVRYSVTVFGPTGQLDRRSETLAARSSSVVDVGAIAQQAGALYAGVFVEVETPGAMVEQRVWSSRGRSIAACANEPSSRWFLADGVTLDGNNEDLILTNPYPSPASVDLMFSVPERAPARPRQFQGFVIPPFATQVIDIDIISRDDPVVSTTVIGNRSNVIVGRSLTMAGSGRDGYSIALGSPSTANSWYFAAGETGDGITERYVIVNPGEEAVDVSLTPYPAQGGANFDIVARTIDAGRSLSIDLTEAVEPAGSLPVGRHAVRVDVQSLNAVEGIVVERVVTKSLENGSFTTVVMGSQFPARRWWLPGGTVEQTQNAVIVSNVDGIEGTLTVLAHTAAGAQPVPGLENLPIGSTFTVALDLTEANALGVPIEIFSDVLIVVEQSATRGQGLVGRTGALAIPE